MSERSGFWNFIANRYARSPVADEASYQRKLAETRAYFQPDWIVFEFGCGTGSTAITHAPHVGHIHAVDISRNMLEIAREKAAAAGVTNVTFEEAGIGALQAPSEHYDAALGMSILHLVEDRKAVLEKIHDLLKPGGMFFSSTVCIGEMNPLVGYLLPIGGFLRVLPLVKSITVEDLLAEISAAGFEIESHWKQESSPAAFVIARKPV